MPRTGDERLSPAIDGCDLTQTMSRLHLAIAQVRPRKGDVPGNLRRVGDVLRQASLLDPRPQVVHFAETVLSGYFVEGGVRDVAHSRAIGYPIWASDITPVTGKWRLETVEINGPIEIGGVRVAAGDLVVADDTGVCFIPRDLALEVLDAAEQKAKAEAIRCKAIDDGVPVPDISRTTYGEK